MQKVEGSSPFIRFQEAPLRRGFVCPRIDGRRQFGGISAGAARHTPGWLSLRVVLAVTGASYAGLPASTHRRKTATSSSGHAWSQGIEPSSSRLRMSSECSATSSCFQRSNFATLSIAPRSRSLNRGRTSRSKLLPRCFLVVSMLRLFFRSAAVCKPVTYWIRSPESAQTRRAARL